MGQKNEAHFQFLHSNIQGGWGDSYMFTQLKERKCDLRYLNLSKLFVIIVVTDIYKQGFLKTLLEK